MSISVIHRQSSMISRNLWTRFRRLGRQSNLQPSPLLSRTLCSYLVPLLVQRTGLRMPWLKAVSVSSRDLVAIAPYFNYPRPSPALPPSLTWLYTATDWQESRLTVVLSFGNYQRWLPTMYREYFLISNIATILIILQWPSTSLYLTRRTRRRVALRQMAPQAIWDISSGVRFKNFSSRAWYRFPKFQRISPSQIRTASHRTGVQYAIGRS